MNWVDYLLLVLVAVSAVHGLRLGAASQVLSFGGFWLGLFLGALAAPPLVGLATNKETRSIIAMSVVFGAAFILGGVGRFLGARSATALRRVRLGAVDAAAGVAVAVVATLVASWLVGSFLANSRFTTLDAALQQSRVLHVLDDALPPVPSVFSRVESFLGSEGFPIVFAGLPPEAAPPVSLPHEGAVRIAVLKAARSTVQIAGSGCGVIQEGSGFVVAPGLVVTNAHVIAGVPGPYVVDATGHHPATPVLFDPHLDLAVLRVPGLTDPPLTIDPEVVGRGTSAVVLGYPEGGPFDYKPAAVAASFMATGLDIYGKTETLRQVYQIDAVVQPGNSGGPLVSSGDTSHRIPDGTVIGVVFARSTINPRVGYALAMGAVQSDLSRVHSTSNAVGTGKCISN
ncbi:MAG TPA: MarP family serine protease [Acidimicrobiales bacterium]|nr:MarP family serine protease [Acidimicrobiales bacterium]